MTRAATKQLIDRCRKASAELALEWTVAGRDTLVSDARCVALGRAAARLGEAAKALCELDAITQRLVPNCAKLVAFRAKMR